MCYDPRSMEWEDRMYRLTWIVVAALVGCQEYDLQEDPPGVTGPRPDIQLEPESLSFGRQLTECPTDPRTVTVRNVGGSELRIDEVRFGGEGSSAYTFTGEPVDLLPGESFELQVVFEAGGHIAYPADLVVESNDPDEGVAAVGLDGEGGDNPFNEDTFLQDTPSSVDVLWVLDNSCSMSGTTAALEGAMDQFISSFVTLGLDYQMGVTTTDMDNPAHQGRLQGPTKVLTSAMTQQAVVEGFDEAADPTSSGSGNEQALAAAYAALEAPGHALQEGLVRDDANLAVIVVGDEDDFSSQQAGYYTSWIDAYKVDPGMTSVSGLVPQSGDFGDIFNDPTGCVEAMAATKLIDVIDSTGGMRAPLCDLDFDQVMQWLSFTAAGLETAFPLSGTPLTGAAGIEVTVDGTSVAEDIWGQEGWRYDSQNNTVVFFGQSIPGPSSSVVITYPVSGTCSS